MKTLLRNLHINLTIKWRKTLNRINSTQHLDRFVYVMISTRKFFFYIETCVNLHNVIIENAQHTDNNIKVILKFSTSILIT